MFNKWLAIATARNLYRALGFMLVILVGMNFAATAFYRSTNSIGMLDLAAGANLLDNRSAGYTPAEAYQMIAAYGEQGRRYHLLLTAADIILPAALATFFALAITYFYSRLFPSGALLRWLLLLPAVYLAADYLENVGIVTMLLSFPAALPAVATLANAMFMIKNLSAAALVVTTLIGLSAWLLRRRREPSTA
jgi:uncharacterized membrane protein YeiB